MYIDNKSEKILHKAAIVSPGKKENTKKGNHISTKNT